ncbi:hypothetical protein SDC9_136817 [bioreactor metagenome]|uniref:Uncharacterized protein n=1 Tax=bioreactor metagenome TaxID=1076179 RepID=A0A645DKB4_9ZZZZ
MIEKVDSNHSVDLAFKELVAEFVVWGHAEFLQKLQEAFVEQMNIL